MLDTQTPQPIDFARIGMIFFPDAFRRRMQLMTGPGRLAHYTTCVNAINIIRKRKVWMRKPQWMADFTEIDHGFDCLNYMYHKGEGGKRFKTALDSIAPGMAERVTKDFDKWLPTYRTNTFVACVTHHDKEEDETGRMSMWNGFAGGGGVALVLNSAPFTVDSHIMGAYSFPVSYCNFQKFDEPFLEIATNIETAVDYLKTVSPDALDQMIHELFRFHLVCTKRHAFRDEREWRVVYSPDRQPVGKIPLVTRHIEFVGGEPQPVCKIPLEAHEGYDVSIPTILDRVILGPGRFRDAVREAFVTELELAGVTDASSRVFYADVPLRM